MTKTTEIVISEQYGRFGVSATAQEWMREQGADFTYDGDIARDDPLLVAAVKRFGSEASDAYADLVVVSIPADVEWVVTEYEGYEKVEESHRIWSSGGVSKRESAGYRMADMLPTDAAR